MEWIEGGLTENGEKHKKVAESRSKKSRIRRVSGVGFLCTAIAMCESGVAGLSGLAVALFSAA